MLGNAVLHGAGEGPEGVGVLLERRERLERGGGAPGEQAEGLLAAEERHEVDVILVGGGRVGIVEEVVGDLEGFADGGAEAGHGVDEGLGGSGDLGGHGGCGHEEGAGLFRVHRAEGFCGSFGDTDVADLPSHHAAGSCGGGEVPCAGGTGGMGEALVAGDHEEGLGEQGIAGEDGDVFTVDPVEGRSATPFVVVIHAREIVVHEAVGVDELEGEGGRERILGLRAEGSAGGEAQDGADALAAAEERVAHGVREGFRAMEPACDVVEPSLHAFQVVREVGAEGVGEGVDHRGGVHLRGAALLIASLAWSS